MRGAKHGGGEVLPRVRRGHKPRAAGHVGRSGREARGRGKRLPFARAKPPRPQGAKGGGRAREHRARRQELLHGARVHLRRVRGEELGARGKHLVVLALPTRLRHARRRRLDLHSSLRREEEAATRRAALLPAAADPSPARAPRERTPATQHRRDDSAAERHRSHDAPPRRARRARARRRVERTRDTRRACLRPGRGVYIRLARANPIMNSESQARVCVPVCASNAGGLSDAVARASSLADVIELRFDCLEDGDVEEALTRLAGIVAKTPLHFIITNRPAGQGGRRALEARERLNFWRRTSELMSDADVRARVYADVELDLLESTHAGHLREILKGFTLICSQHDFGQTPSDLGALYERMARTGARVLKVAAHAEDVTDCASVLALVERARRDRVEMIAVSMGEAGVPTRVLAPVFGAALTYGSLERGRETAPGQFTVRELRDIYRVQKMDADTILTGLVGSPVAHSLSPHMHNAAFHARGLNAVYVPFEVSDV